MLRDRPDPFIDHMTSVALGEMELAQGRPEPALAHLASVARQGPGIGDPLIRLNAAPAFVEASVLAGQPDPATAVVASFADWFTATGSLPNLALLARMRALLAATHAADAHFEEALDLHGRTQRPFDRARSELRASGETPRRRKAGSADQLTPQELQVARLVAAGATSKETASQLFLSPRTIDAHLRNIYAKLGITSRSQLRDAGHRDHPRPAARRLGPRRVRASLVRRHRYRLDRAVRHNLPPPHRLIKTA